jgi:hypothetical protein
MSEPPPQRSLCVLLHNLIVGGSALQWLHLLEPAAAAGARVTIVAPSGALATYVRDAGIELIEVDWATVGTALDEEPWPRVAEHEVAVVHWEQQVTDVFTPALEACGRAALTIHQSPTAVTRWFDKEFIESSRAALDLALRHHAAVVLATGEHHRQRFIEAFDLPAQHIRILPASIPIPPSDLPTVGPGTGEVLALVRLSPEKAAVVRLALELVAAGLAAGDSPHLRIAGEGPWRDDALRLCEDVLPAGSWRLEPAPADPIARLAAADFVVAQGLTTLEAAAVGRSTVVAREVGNEGVAGVLLRPGNYDEAARDPFGIPAVSEDTAGLWRELRVPRPAELATLRELVAAHNSIEAGHAALVEALAATAPGLPAWRRDDGPL